MTQPVPWPWRIPLLGSAVLGGLYGGGFRLLAHVPFLRSYYPAGFVMTIGFLFLGPLAIGYITIAVAESSGPRLFWQWLVVPWGGVALSVLITWLFNLEGLICIVFALPVAMVLSSIGGVCAGVAARFTRKHRGAAVACAAVLPLLIAPMEGQRVRSPLEYRAVQTQIRIHAPAAVVWSNIERVRAIAPAELRPAWTHAIGFPRPVEATLTHEGIGGVRHATFEHGLLFIETVTAWEPDRLLAFSIRADTAEIPPTTLDEHVTIGGRYFDVLQGAYRIEPAEGGDVVLHLSSQERLSTDFNEYAGLWSDAVMRSLQTSILQVIRNRCEQSAVRR